MAETELHAVADQLRRSLAAAETRVQHLRAALREIEALLANGDPAPVSRGRAGARSGDTHRAPGTGAALLTVLRRSGPSRSWTAHELASELAGQGLAPASADPANAVRTALGRLLQDDRIERVGHGQYRVKGEPALEGEPAGGLALDSEGHDEGASRTHADVNGLTGDQDPITT